MESNNPSSSSENSKNDSCCVLRSKEKTPLKLCLTRVFSSNALRSPKSPSSSDSQGSSPSCSTSPVKARYSWQIHSSKNKDNRSSRSSESGIFLSSPSKSSMNEICSDSSENCLDSPKNCTSPTWYVNTG